MIRFLKLFSLVFFTTLLSFSCTKTAAPTEVAQKFLTAVYNADFENAKTFATQTTIEELSKLEQMMQDPIKNTVTIKGETIDGDKATVQYTVIEADNLELTLHLIKENGEWKAETTKFELTGIDEKALNGLNDNLEKVGSDLEKSINEAVEDLGKDISKKVDDAKDK